MGELTGFPELFDGRVKTLHPRVFGGILFDRSNPGHDRERREHGIPRLDTVVVNLYPFEATVAREGATLEEAVEQIDIGGVALIRAAAKNFAHVTVLVDPEQYPRVVAAGGAVDVQARRRFATRAFERTAEYDSSIARYLEAGLLATELPGSLALTLPLASPCATGRTRSRAPPSTCRAPSICPSNSAARRSRTITCSIWMRRCGCWCARPSRRPLRSARRRRRCAPRSSSTPFPAAWRNAPSASEATRLALDADAISAYGGIIALDGAVDDATAAALAGFFLEIVAAPDFDVAALARLRARRRTCGSSATTPRLPERLAKECACAARWAACSPRTTIPRRRAEEWRVVSQRPPSAAEWRDLRFAWDVVRHVKSNGVVIVRDAVTRGICAGQTNRVSAVRIAGARAGAEAIGSACASDGFFPFADGLEAAVDAGCSAIIAPGGSIRDADVIAAADRLGVALVFSTYRYFLH